MLATQPVVDASRPSFEVGEDLVDPRQDEVSGGLPDDMDIVAIGGDRSVAGPAVGFRDPPAQVLPADSGDLVDYDIDNELRSGSTMLARSLWASSQALR